MPYLRIFILICLCFASCTGFGKFWQESSSSGPGGYPPPVTLDKSFNGTGFKQFADLGGAPNVSEMTFGLIFDSSGKIIVSGNTGSPGSPINYDLFSCRLNSDGSLDASYGGSST